MTSLSHIIRSHSLISCFFILTSLISFVGCQKDKNTEPDVVILPVSASVQTTSLTFRSPNSVSLTGELITAGNQEIVDHGFVYGYTEDISISKGMKKSLGAGPVSKVFDTNIDDIPIPPNTGVQTALFAKAYITDKTGTSYGQVKSSFYTKSFLTEMDKRGGKVGDKIKISGDFKNLKVEQITVSFRLVPAEITIFSNEYIIVEVPKGIPVSHGETVPVTVQIGLLISHPTLAFIVDANFTDFSPKSGPIGTKITFTGDNLPNKPEATQIHFDDAYFNNYYDTEFYTRVPSGVTNVKTKLYYSTSSDFKAPLPFEFTVTPHIFKSITPNPALDQEEITIHLDNFESHLVGNDPLVRIGIFSTYVRPNENGDLVFKLGGSPSANKSYPITVHYGPHTITPPIQLAVVNPYGLDFSPKSGNPGTRVIITGKFAKGGILNVSMGSGLGAPAEAISDTQLAFNIPMGIEDKPYPISLSRWNNPDPIPVPGVFQGQSTKFKSISPLSGPAGTTVTINAEGLYNHQSNSYTVNFGGPIAHSSEDSSTKIIMTVPEQTAPGTYPIRLYLVNMLVETGLFFTVTK